MNLKHRYPHDVSATAIQLAYCLALALAFPVSMFPAVRVIEALLFKDVKSNAVTWQVRPIGDCVPCYVCVVEVIVGAG